MATPPAELEGVLAHELAHIRNRDVLVQTAAVVVAAALIETSRVGGWLQRTLLFVLGPLAAAIVHLLLSPKREFAADRAAAALCGSPHGLADALLRLEQAAELVEFRASPATEPLYTINPFAEEGLAGAVRDAPAGRRARPPAREPSTPTGATSCARPRTTKSRAWRLFVNEIVGGDLLSREVALRVPSARAGLTSLFGMGRGVPPPLSPPKLSRARVKRTLKTP